MVTRELFRKYSCVKILSPGPVGDLEDTTDTGIGREIQAEGARKPLYFERIQVLTFALLAGSMSRRFLIQSLVSGEAESTVHISTSTRGADTPWNFGDGEVVV